jgi:hypothetical protein
MNNILTKTDFLKYLEAPRHLWAFRNNKLDEQKEDLYQQHLLKQGYEVEELAEKYLKTFPGLEKLLQPTSQDANFEARTDMLIKNPETKLWDMYEIKSTTRLDKIHKKDATYQYLVFKKNYDLGTVNIVHLSKDYVRNGDINLKELFVVSDISEEVENLKDEVHNLRYEALEVLNIEDPSEILECIKPKDCPCLSICHPNLPNYSIYDINNLTGNEKKIRELVSLGIRNILDVPSSFRLSAKQRHQVTVAQNGEIEINDELLKESFSKIEYPIYYIDYESFNSAIPMYDGYKPYYQIPFQWSLHIKREEKGNVEHYEFLETKAIDPIPNFLIELKKHLDDNGSIVVWHKSFECTLNKKMGEIHPEFKNFCENMNSRIFDLMDIFRDQIYSDPECKGSYSIKNVLPVLVPGLSYNVLEISNGSVAMTSWYDMVYGNLKKEEKEKIRKNLLKYCELDTFAMVEIMRRLLAF